MRGRSLLGLLVATVSLNAIAEIPNSYRTERWEGGFRFLGLQGQTLNGDRSLKCVLMTISASGSILPITWMSTCRWGSLEVDTFRTTNQVDPTGRFDGRGELEMTTMNLNGTYHFFRKALTPYVQGAIGATYLDTNVPTGPSVPVCWWDPWWGYYCGFDTPTLSDTVFSYEVGAGVRLDVNDRLFMRGGYSQQWLDVDRGVDTLDQGLWRFGVGWFFR